MQGQYFAFSSILQTHMHGKSMQTHASSSIAREKVTCAVVYNRGSRVRHPSLRDGLLSNQPQQFRFITLSRCAASVRTVYSLYVSS